MPLQAGQIYNSNRATLVGLVQSLGMMAVDLGVVPDRQEATQHVLKKAAMRADVIISAGGVSVGEEDHVKRAVDQIGSVEFWKVAIKPGKPLAFGHVGNTPFIGLPGNPASVFTTFMILARPFLMACQCSPVNQLPVSRQRRCSTSLQRSARYISRASYSGWCRDLSQSE